MPAASPSDFELYSAWANGDRNSGTALIDRYLAKMARFFANKVNSAGEAEDLVSDTFERCAKTLGRLDPGSSFQAFLYGIARNVLREHLRARARADRCVPGEPGDDELMLGGLQSLHELGDSPCAALIEKREQRLLLEGLRHVPVDYQLVLELVFFEGMSRRDIAELLGWPAGTVASRTRRGRELLLEKIEELASSPRVLQSTVTRLDDWAREVAAQLGRVDGRTKLDN